MGPYRNVRDTFFYVDTSYSYLPFSMRPNAVRRLSAGVFYAKAPTEIVLRKLNIPQIIFSVKMEIKI